MQTITTPLGINMCLDGVMLIPVVCESQMRVGAFLRLAESIIATLFISKHSFKIFGIQTSGGADVPLGYRMGIVFDQGDTVFLLRQNVRVRKGVNDDLYAVPILLHPAGPVKEHNLDMMELSHNRKLSWTELPRLEPLLPTSFGESCFIKPPDGRPCIARNPFPQSWMADFGFKVEEDKQDSSAPTENPKHIPKSEDKDNDKNYNGNNNKGVNNTPGLASPSKEIVGAPGLEPMDNPRLANDKLLTANNNNNNNKPLPVSHEDTQIQDTPTGKRCEAPQTDAMPPPGHNSMKDPDATESDKGEQESTESSSSESSESTSEMSSRKGANNILEVSKVPVEKTEKITMVPNIPIRDPTKPIHNYNCLLAPLSPSHSQDDSSRDEPMKPPAAATSIHTNTSSNIDTKPNTINTANINNNNTGTMIRRPVIRQAYQRGAISGFRSFRRLNPLSGWESDNGLGFKAPIKSAQRGSGVAGRSRSYIANGNRLKEGTPIMRSGRLTLQIGSNGRLVLTERDGNDFRMIPRKKTPSEPVQSTNINTSIKEEQQDEHTQEIDKKREEQTASVVYREWKELKPEKPSMVINRGISRIWRFNEFRNCSDRFPHFVLMRERGGYVPDLPNLDAIKEKIKKGAYKLLAKRMVIDGSKAKLARQAFAQWDAEARECARGNKIMCTKGKNGVVTYYMHGKEATAQSAPKGGPSSLSPEPNYKLVTVSKSGKAINLPPVGPHGPNTNTKSNSVIQFHGQQNSTIHPTSYITRVSSPELKALVPKAPAAVGGSKASESQEADEATQDTNDEECVAASQINVSLNSVPSARKGLCEKKPPTKRCEPYCLPLAPFGVRDKVCPKCGEIVSYPTRPEGETNNVAPRTCTSLCIGTSQKTKTKDLDYCCICLGRRRKMCYDIGCIHQCKMCDRPWLRLTDEFLCRSCHGKVYKDNNGRKPYRDVPMRPDGTRLPTRHCPIPDQNTLVPLHNNGSQGPPLSIGGTQSNIRAQYQQHLFSMFPSVSSSPSWDVPSDRCDASEEPTSKPTKSFNLLDQNKVGQGSNTTSSRPQIPTPNLYTIPTASKTIAAATITTTTTETRDRGSIGVTPQNVSVEGGGVGGVGGVATDPATKAEPKGTAPV